MYLLILLKLFFLKYIYIDFLVIFEMYFILIFYFELIFYYKKFDINRF